MEAVIEAKLKKNGRDIGDIKGIQVVRVPKKSTTKVTTEKTRLLKWKLRPKNPTLKK